MKALIQRVASASVSVGGEIVGEIDAGILLLLGVEKDDSLETVSRMVDKVLKYRVFSDDTGKMNNSLGDVGGGLLVVSQFTLVADTKKGLRPSFSSGASPELGRQIYEQFVEIAKSRHPRVETGIYAAEMKVSLLNDGPVTFLLEIR